MSRDAPGETRAAERGRRRPIGPGDGAGRPGGAGRQAAGRIAMPGALTDLSGGTVDLPRVAAPRIVAQVSQAQRSAKSAESSESGFTTAPVASTLRRR